MKFVERIGEYNPIVTGEINTLQVNVGKVCNLACKHCHVEANPKRTESMTFETIEKLDVIMKKFPFETLDITGGEPTMHPHFKELVRMGNENCERIILRTNLVNLIQKGNEDYIDFLKGFKVNIVASLPCYTKENTDEMRGAGTFVDSIEAIKRLNKAGYGLEDGLVLDLVYNPGGAFLPGPQKGLENDYKRILLDQYGIVFNNLFTITNLPIGRFKDDLERKGTLGEYEKLLMDNFNIGTLENLMCKNQISVSYDGYIYDCDFNQMIDLKCGKYSTIDDLLELDSLSREVILDDHCYGCTAGAGSSCGGALE